MPNEIHLKQPVWYGDRSNPCVGIAHFRLVKDGKPRKGQIKIWVDYKVTDNNTGLPTLAYPYPFSIPCIDALKYPTQVLNDFHRTMLHIIPISKLRVIKTHRKRTMPQDEFKDIVNQANMVK
jgi:hypothetical protein